MKTKQKTKREIIQETANAYTSKTRAVSITGLCFYKAGHYKCAVGRCLLSKSKMFNKCNLTEPVRMFTLDNHLKSEYIGHDIEFWGELQILHDANRFWDVNGLTMDGQEEVYRLLGKWGDNE
mgnify:CR=1 FL=1